MEQLGFHDQVIIILSSFKLRPGGAPNTKTSRAIKGGLTPVARSGRGFK